ncbi:MAG: hypothetical protein A4S09_07635 [Proteobacteria bacterium SG_bin7]|nr:MAG: hypothetical protein A4S09_07635 [Proteobacteria bacterium SG_bin7]
MGIDPGLRFTGVGIVAEEAGQCRYLRHDIIMLSHRLSPAERLAILLERLSSIISEFSPTLISLEKAFFGKNADSAFKLGLARGVVMAIAGKNNIRVAEYATKAVKKGITGHGSSEKETVALFVQRILRVDLSARFDASDALALALFAAMNCDRENLLASRGIEV